MQGLEQSFQRSRVDLARSARFRAAAVILEASEFIVPDGSAWPHRLQAVAKRGRQPTRANSHLTLSVDLSQIFRGRHFVRKSCDGLSVMQELG